ncbi:MAG: hypothetical protein OXI63_26105 [Candidatus Poribacteria bacterium]|nr:hypothetical protein [Candidatus Poribacteria bacterium]
MKTIFLFSILFCAIAIPTLAELTEADLNKIRLIVKEEVSADREGFEKDIKEYINTKNESIEKRLSLVTTLIVGLMALIGFPLVVLTVMIGWRSVKDSTQEKKNIRELAPEDRRVIEQLIRDQEKKIESLTQEIETLKQQRTVNP